MLIKKSNNRFWEIDFLRGIAVIMMIIFHLLYDLNYFDIYKIDLFSGYFLIYLNFGATIFLLLVGISLSLSYSRSNKSLAKKELQSKYIFRGLKIFALGLVITLVSWLYLTEGFVIFGVLHCIGLSIILAYPFLRFRYLNLALGSVLIFVGIVLKNFTFDFNWLIWLGFSPSQFYTIDYFPLLPWFGVVLIGIFLGNVLYPNFKRMFKLRELGQQKAVSMFCFLGRYSLIIYFIHQPILLALIYVYSTII
jgi:uncharacterized membrane protein